MIHSRSYGVGVSLLNLKMCTIHIKQLLHYFASNLFSEFYSWCRVAKSAQNAGGPQVISSLSLADDEIIIDVDGTVPTQPVLQHIGMSAWPGNL